jgi:fructokinase
MGGAPGNFALHAAALGARAAVVSAVGDDAAGEEIVGRYRTAGVDTSAVAVDRAHPTGTARVAVDERGRVRFDIGEDVAWDYIPLSPAAVDLAGRADAVLFGTLGQRAAVSRATTIALLAETRRAALRVFDTNLRPPHYSDEVIETSLYAANALKTTGEELTVLARLLSLEGGEDAQVKTLMRRYELRAVALTKGEQGSVLSTRRRRVAHGAAPADVVDTVGAGDAFLAAFVLGLLRGDDLDAIGRRANRVAAYVCTQPGATPTLPDELRRQTT